MSVQVMCDNCGRDVTSTGNSNGYRLALRVETVPTRPGPVTDMDMIRPLDADYQFCGAQCFKEWLHRDGFDLMAGRP